MPSEPREKREPIREEDSWGLKYFRKLWPLFERLREVGCQRDKAGNRQLFMDQYCSLVLLFMFNPCVRSLAGVATSVRTPERAAKAGLRPGVAGVTLRSDRRVRSGAAP